MKSFTDHFGPKTLEVKKVYKREPGTRREAPLLDVNQRAYRVWQKRFN